MDSELKDNITMEHDEIITDELIAKYISGKTNEEENHLIHDYLAQNPEFANDLLDIAAALQHQRKHNETTGTVSSEQLTEAVRVKFNHRRTFYAIAASVAVIIVFGLLFFKSTARFDTEQTMIADADTEITNTTLSNKEGGNDLNQTVITPIDLQPEESLLADNQETPPQTLDNTIQPQPEESLLADNTTPNTPQQQEVGSSSHDDNASMMAALTESEDYSNYPTQKDAVFVTDSIPTEWNPNKDLVLKWTCNTSSLKLEFSTDHGSTWKTPYDVSGQNSFKIRSRRLQDFRIDNPQSFNWRMTAQYSDGKLVRQGTIRFADGNE